MDYLLAHLLLKSYDDDRRGLLQRAANSFTAFLGKLNAYELLSKQNQQLLDKYLEDSSSFCLAPSNDAAGRRHVKVGRYQEEKKLKAQLEVSERCGAKSNQESNGCVGTLLSSNKQLSR